MTEGCVANDGRGRGRMTGREQGRERARREKGEGRREAVGRWGGGEVG